MIKFKLFMSLAKERDWLEYMATQGWLLTNMTFGVFYNFEKVEPCEKVYEVERFAITKHPTVAELTARTRALDITSQFGWRQVTHDEDMNYYFIKDKAGDETDEFYDDEESRMERAERYRKHYSIEQPLSLLRGDIALSFLYIIIFLAFEFIAPEKSQPLQHGLMWFYIVLIVFETVMTFILLKAGQQHYKEFSMSRKEWESYRKYTEKKRFKKVQQLRSYLQEKSEFGLSLKGYEDGHFLFEEASQRYNYFIDTKSCLKKRLKEDGLQYKDDTKDLATQGLKWYEMSIANAAQYGLKPVAITNKSVLIYKRPYSDEPLPWENGNANISYSLPSLIAIIFLLICCIAGYIGGYLMARIIL